MDKLKLNTGPGAVYPLGATVQDGTSHGKGFQGKGLQPEGVNFSLFSKNAAMVELLLFDEAKSAKPSSVIKRLLHGGSATTGLGLSDGRCGIGLISSLSMKWAF